MIPPAPHAPAAPPPASARDCRIRILPEEVASQIAAGEVAERPASVVKELVENAVDAGATRIVVEVEDGGRALIRVGDNGGGMTAQEAVIALQRHATSKITAAEDLAAIRTLGFRGEALPSVASVARLTVLTRARGDLEGTRLEAEAGEIRALEPAAAPEGTVVTVRDLFFNTPARLKFLKTTRTELGQVCDAVTRTALSHPAITFRLVAEGEEVLHAPASADPLNTITALLGAEVARDLLALGHSRPGLEVRGYVSRPPLSRPTRGGQQFFVNGRWVRNRTLTHAVDEAFRGSLPGGRFPVAIVHVEVDPALVDVNVHPAKSEVRFLRDWEVHRAVLEAVRQALGAPTGPVPPAPLARQQALDPTELRAGPWLPAEPVAGSSPPAAAEAAPAPSVPSAPSAPPAPAPQPALPDLHAPAVRLRPIAQLWQSYILAEGPAGLVILDQHLVHERVLFDRIRAAAAAGELPVQRLAVPATLQLTHREAVAADELQADLARAGFELEPFGRDSFLVRSAPAFVRPGHEAATLRLLIEEMLEARRSGGDGAADPARALAGAACHAAVKKGAHLGPEEMAQLLDDLGRTANPHTCPHGCPIAVEISFQELLRRFKRT